MENKKIWNSLERAKFIMSVITALISLFLTIGLFYYGNKYEKTKWTNQTLTTKKLELYESMMPKFNAILCYMNDYGTFKEHSPKEIIDFKRSLNLTYYTNRDFFSPDFKKEYLNFIDNLCFENYSGKWDSQIKKDFSYSKAGYEKMNHENPWDNSWNEMFTNETVNKKEIENSYYRLMNLFIDDMGFIKE
ncbi:hypothetical protein [Seonamhaeicola marinus]|uniref:Uncharacterized protein n=1 Tax=Seonamhaeicola marinus TaxID=1912246 RepID=A0A5D0I402_9FLAO|nr:hypothetical protein [Seonamhaeicola marinus]TYA78396.1 hypothetical protein FUA24_08545 [Seonamhaeicola marinus]